MYCYWYSVSTVSLSYVHILPSLYSDRKNENGFRLRFPLPSSLCDVSTYPYATGINLSRKHGRPGLAVIGRSHSSLFQDRPVRRRSTVSKRTTFTKSGRPHVYAPIQMHDVITSPKSKNKIYQTTRRQHIWRRTVLLHCLFTDYSFTVKLLPTSLTKAVRRLVESPYSLTPYQSTRRYYHIHIPHFIPWLSTQLRTAFFREVASSFTRN